MSGEAFIVIYLCVVVVSGFGAVVAITVSHDRRMEQLMKRSQERRDRNQPC